jgi:transporter family-2 protein
MTNEVGFMLTLIIIIVIGILGGMAASLQALFSGVMGQRLGDVESVFVTYAGGGLLIALILLLLGGGNLANWRIVPWYVFLAGPLGLVIVGSLSYTVPRLGGATASTLFVATWLIIGAILDHLGWFGVSQRSLDLPRLLGVVTLLAGTWLMVRE